MTKPSNPPAFQRLWAAVDKDENILYAFPTWRVIDSIRMPFGAKLRFIKCRLMSNRQIKKWDAILAEKEKNAT